MKIIGFNLNKISIEKKEAFEGQLKINQNIDIKELIEDEIPISTEKPLKITFNFIINYDPNLAKIEFEGNIIIIPEKEQLKRFLESWKNKQIPEQDRTPLFNFIMAKCNVKALALEDELNLPLHIPMPRLDPSKQEPKKDNSQN